MAGRGRILDISDEVFGRLTAKRLANPEEKPATKQAQSKAHWVCECACGGKGIYCSKDLRTGHVRSCGCLHRAIKPAFRWKNYLATVPTAALKRELARRQRQG